jgi:signal transduction histidine kinase
MLETSGVPVFGKDGSFKGYRGIDRDITVRKKAEEELKFRLKFENVLSSISTDFITMPVEEIDACITKALERIGELVSVDRSYIFLFREDGKKMDNTHEWCSKGITPAIDQLQDLNPRDFYMVRTMIDARNVVQIESLSELPPEAEVDRKEFESEGIKSLVLVPLYVEDTDVGFIGFDSVKKEREWTPDTISLLKIVGEIIVSAVVRKKAQEAIIQERNRAELYLDLLGHDIGNLHQGIYTSLQIANMKKDMGGDPSDVIARAEEVTKRSMKLVKTVLLLSRLRSLDPDLKPINICDTIQQSIETMHKVFPNKDIEVTPICKDSCVPILAEPLISELFFNLLHNGIKFQEGKLAKLEVDVIEKEGHIEIHFCDHGPGISDEMKKSMFKRFQTGGNGSQTGLGLSLVKALVDRYKGTIVVSDRIEGDPTQGARFIVSFPVMDDVNNLRAGYSSVSSLLS